MNRRRLFTLKRHLEKLPARMLRMESWVQGGFWSSPSGIRSHSKLMTEIRNCQTAACALGHACTIPSFQRDGLKLDEWELPRLRRGRYRFKGYDAGKAFFDLTRDQTNFLFNPCTYALRGSGHVTPKRVVKRIEALLNGYAVPEFLPAERDSWSQSVLTY